MSDKKFSIGFSIGGNSHHGHHGHHGYHGHNRPILQVTPAIVHQTIIPAPPSYSQTVPVVQQPSLPSAPPSYSPSYNPPPAASQTNNTAAYTWIATSIHTCDAILHKAVQAGHAGHDQAPIYVGRAWHEGDLTPCKVIPRHNVAFISHNMMEVTVFSFELYCRNSPIVTWVGGANGSIPQGAVPVGHTDSGEVLYAGRAYHEASLVLGKVHASHGCCYLPYNGQEITKRNYEVMVLSNP